MKQISTSQNTLTGYEPNNGLTAQDRVKAKLDTTRLDLKGDLALCVSTLSPKAPRDLAYSVNPCVTNAPIHQVHTTSVTWSQVVKKGKIIRLRLATRQRILMNFSELRHKKIGLQMPQLFAPGEKLSWACNHVELNNDGTIAKIYVYDSLPEPTPSTRPPQEYVKFNMYKLQETNQQFANEVLIKETLTNLMKMYNHQNPYLISMIDYENASVETLNMLLRTYYQPDDLVSVRNLKTFAINVARSYDDHEYEKIMQAEPTFNYEKGYEDLVVEENLFDNLTMDIDGLNKYRHHYALVVEEQPSSPPTPADPNKGSIKPLASSLSNPIKDMESSNVKFKRSKFDKLNSKNYKYWKTRMELYLEDMGQWDELKNAPNPGRNTWKELMFNIDDDQFAHVEQLKCGQLAWKALEAQYNQQDRGKKMFIIRNFLKFDYKSGTSMPDHISQFKRLRNELTDIKLTIPEEVQCSILISSLPDTYEIEKRTWEQIGDAISLNDLFGKINNLEDKEESPTDLALSGRNLYCATCKTNTHDTKSCYKNNKNKTSKTNNRSHKRYNKHKKDKNKNDQSKSDYSLSASRNLQDNWILDSGASMHITGNPALLQNLKNINPQSVMSANGAVLQATHVGSAKIEKKDMTIHINEVHYVPGMTHNLLSISAIANTYEVKFQNKTCTIEAKDGTKLLSSKQHNGLYTVPAYVLAVTKTNEPLKKPAISMKDAHLRLGHINSRKIKEMAMNNQLPFNLLESKEEPFTCNTCNATKTTRSAISKKSQSTYTKVGELIHTDIWGPIKIKSKNEIKHEYNDHRYFISFIDEFTGYTTIYPMKKKSDAYLIFKEYCQSFFNLHGNNSIKNLRSDNGGEYTSRMFKEICHKNGIRQQFTAPYSSFQNGVAERKNRTIIEGTRALLHEAQADQSLWVYAALFETKLLNCVYDSKRKIIPFEGFHRRAAAELLNSVETWGRPLWVYIHMHQRNKLEPTAKKGIYLGPDPKRKAIFALIDQKVISTRDYKVQNGNITKGIHNERENDDHEENIMEFPSDDDTDSDIEIIVQQTADQIQPQTTEPQVQEMNNEYDAPTFSHQTPSTPNRATKSDIQQFLSSQKDNMQSLSKTRSKTKGTFEYQDKSFPAPRAIAAPPQKESRRQNSKANNRGAAYAAITLKPSAALTDPSWFEAMKAEMDSQIENHSWTLVPKTTGMHVLPCQWVFAIKQNPDGSNKYKARLVVGGHRQKEGIDFKETFAPVLKYTSLRILLALATFHDFEVHQIDFVTAFLNADLEETIFMQQPYGFSDGTDKVCQLQKGVYGLRQSPRQWSIKVTEILAKLGFQCLDDADESIYMNPNWNNTKHFIIIAVYVDDCVLVSNSKTSLNEVEDLIADEYKMKKLGELKNILNMTWTRNRTNRTSSLTQERYTEDVLTRFQMNNSKAALTPATKETIDETALLSSNEEYMQAIGSLIYLTTCTRPDIAYAVSKVAEKMQTPTTKDWIAVKRIFRYLQGTRTLGIHFNNSQSKTELTLEAYTDADWAADPSRKSRSANVLFLAEGPITWYSKKQSCIALSTVEAEYVSGSKAVQEIIWVKKLLHMLKFPLSKTTLYLDNQGAIATTKNPTNHARTKHIDIRLHFMRDKYQKKEFELTYCPTTDMIADVLTKALSKPLHVKHATSLMDYSKYSQYSNQSQEGVLNISPVNQYSNTVFKLGNPDEIGIRLEYFGKELKMTHSPKTYTAMPQHVSLLDEIDSSTNHQEDDWSTSSNSGKENDESFSFYIGYK